MMSNSVSRRRRTGKPGGAATAGLRTVKRVTSPVASFSPIGFIWLRKSIGSRPSKRALQRRPLWPRENLDQIGLAGLARPEHADAHRPLGRFGKAQRLQPGPMQAARDILALPADDAGVLLVHQPGAGGLGLGSDVAALLRENSEASCERSARHHPTARTPVSSQ